VHQTVLRSWVKAFADDPAHAFPGQGQVKSEQAEIARLKREVTKLRIDLSLNAHSQMTTRQWMGKQPQRSFAIMLRTFRH
jgi:hypothetical protein